MTTIVSYSKIKRWRFCRQSYYFAHVEKITPKRKPRPLKLGSIVHAMLESIAKGKDWKPILNQVTEEYSHMLEEERDFYGDLPSDSSKIVTGYQRMWAPQKVKYQLIEETLGPIPLTKSTALEMRIDRLVKELDTKMTFLCETKTGRRIPKEEIRIWDLQTIVYIWGLRQLGYKVDGIIWDYLRTKTPVIPELLKGGALTRRKDIDTDYRTYLQAIKDNGLNPKDYEDFLETLKGREATFYRRVRLPVSEPMVEPILEDVKTTSLEIHWLVENPVKNISGYTCPRCQYQSLCYAQLRGLDEEFIRRTEFINKEEEIDYSSEEED